MPQPRLHSWLAVAGLLIVVALTFDWLMLIYGGDRTGMTTVPGPDADAAEFLSDPNQQLSRAEAEALPLWRWRTLSPQARSLSHDGGAVWVRMSLSNPADSRRDGVLSSRDYFPDRVEAWVQTGADWQHCETGEQVAGPAKALWGRDIAFPIAVPARSAVRVYLRASDRFVAVLALNWWPNGDAFHAMQLREMLAEGLYFGGLLALLGYNSMLWVRLRLADIGYYTLTVAANGIFVFLARGQVATLGWTLPSPALESVLVVAMALSASMLTRFARIFLQLDSLKPSLGRAAQTWSWAVLVPSIGAVLVPGLGKSTWMPVGVVIVGLTHAGLLTTAILASRGGIRHARFFLLSFGCLFAASLPAIGIWLLQWTAQDAGMKWVMIGSALEMLLLSLAVADRFAQAQLERSQAQERLLEETEQRRAIEEAYADELATEVRERTKELETANADKDRVMAVVGHDLRGPLTGLTQRAEQLANSAPNFGALHKFAGDSATLGRQILLLIEDLVLWARMRAGQQPPPIQHSLQALVAPVAVLHRVLAGHHGIELTVLVPEELRVSTDLVLAQTLLRNLVANALKVARQRVVVSAAAPSGTASVIITVRDDGPGLPPAVAAALAQGEIGLATTGGGLGLRLCAEIAANLQARLQTANLPEGGTEFTFSLPSSSLAP